MKTLIFIHAIDKNDNPLIFCCDTKGNILLMLDNVKDVHAMKVGGLEPGNDEDVFAYAIHLLKRQFKRYFFYQSMEHKDKYESKTLLVDEYRTSLRKFFEVNREDGVIPFPLSDIYAIINLEPEQSHKLDLGASGITMITRLQS